MRRRRTIEERGRTIPLEWLDPVAAVNTEVAVGTLLLIVIGLTAMVWGAAALSSWWVKGTRAGVGGQEAFLAMIRLGIHRFRWDGAFQPRTQEALAGAKAFWFAFAAESLVLALLFWPIWRVMGPRPGDPMPVYIYPTPHRHPRNERRKARRATADANRTPPPSAPTSQTPPGAPRDTAPPPPPDTPGAPTWGDPPPERLRVPQSDGRRLILGRDRD